MRTAVKQLTVVCASFGLFMCTSIANATEVYLTTPTSQGTIDSVLFSANDQHPTGTGYINPFLRIQNNGTEVGYNTDAKFPPPNDKAGNFTHSLLLSDLVDVGGYYKFLLDINQTSHESLLDLTDLQLFVGGNGNSSQPNFSELGENIWGFAAGDVVHMDYDLNPGSGWGDIYMFVPTDLFKDKSGYFTLYSKFETSNDGFEEWATITSSAPPVPEPGTVTLLAAGLFCIAIYGKRRRNA